MQANGLQNGSVSSSASTLDAAIQLAWTGIVSRRKTPCVEFLSSAAHERINLVIDARIVNDNARVEAWIERENNRQTIVAQLSMACRGCRERGFVHFDIANGNDRVLALSFTDELDPRLVYAQTSLVNSEDFAAGMFDPPTLRSVMINRVERTLANAAAAPM